MGKGIRESAYYYCSGGAARRDTKNRLEPCPECGKKVGVTVWGNYRKHLKPGYTRKGKR